MPELPEVETVRQNLADALTANPTQIQSILLRRQTLRTRIPRDFVQSLTGQTFLSFRRRAKYLLLDTQKFTVISHLGMSGSWRWREKSDLRKHDHCEISFSDGRELVYHDPRRFGILDFVEVGKESQSKWLQHLGVEPLSPEFNAERMIALAKGRKVPIKNFIMDQRVVVGVGNIYASEALFLAKINPRRLTKRLKKEEWFVLVEAVKRVLNQAIERKGTTLRDYIQTTGETGNFQNELFVYDREGEHCRICLKSKTGVTKIRMIQLAGRSTYWCDKCQK